LGGLAGIIACTEASCRRQRKGPRAEDADGS